MFKKRFPLTNPKRLVRLMINILIGNKTYKINMDEYNDKKSYNDK